MGDNCGQDTIDCGSGGCPGFNVSGGVARTSMAYDSVGCENLVVCNHVSLVNNVIEARGSDFQASVCLGHWQSVIRKLESGRAQGT